ncbi:tyrosine kinase, putative, partial [Entamoeba invadens IP1]
STMTKCLFCENSRLLPDNMCHINNCVAYDYNGRCLACAKNYLLNTSGFCEISINCLYGYDNNCLKCAKDYILNNGSCVLKQENCLITDGVLCRKCGSGVIFGKCDICSSGCIHCDGTSKNECIVCATNYILVNGYCNKIENGMTNNKEMISCNNNLYIDDNQCYICSQKYNQVYLCDRQKIIQCEESYYINANENLCISTTCNNNETNEENNLCSSTISNCKHSINSKCLECESEYYLDSNNSCVIYNNLSYALNCEIFNHFGCIRCVEGYYLESNKTCSKCDTSLCQTCYSLTYCLTCSVNKFLSGHQCKSNENLIGKCNKFVTSGGCSECLEGYYKNGLDCYECDTSCSTCFSAPTKCLKCNSTNFKTTSGSCLPRSLLYESCDVEITENGCEKCKDGYYLVDSNQCQKCDSNCKTCYSFDMCLTCTSDKILVDSKCKNYSSINNCKAVSNSKCSKCTFWYTPSENGTFCVKKAVWWVILIIIVFTIAIIVGVFLIFTCLIKSYLKHT